MERMRNKDLENAWAVQLIRQEKCAKLEEENKNLKSDLEQFSEAYKRYRDYEKEELAESCYDLEIENKKLREIITDLSKSNYKSVNQRNDLERENKKLKFELELKNLALKQAQEGSILI